MSRPSNRRVLQRLTKPLVRIGNVDFVKPSAPMELDPLFLGPQTMELEEMRLDVPMELDSMDLSDSLHTFPDDTIEVPYDKYTFKRGSVIEGRKPRPMDFARGNEDDFVDALMDYDAYVDPLPDSDFALIVEPDMKDLLWDPTPMPQSMGGEPTNLWPSSGSPKLYPSSGDPDKQSLGVGKNPTLWEPSKEDPEEEKRRRPLLLKPSGPPR